MRKMKLKDLHAALLPLSPVARSRVARKAKTSPAMLSQYAHGHRQMSAAKAAMVEKATGVPRESLCAACGKCDLAVAGRAHQQLIGSLGKNAILSGRIERSEQAAKVPK